MDFFIENLKETIDAVNKIIDRKISYVDVKRIRKTINVKSSNRSKINFIWRSLKVLENDGILRCNGSNSPKTYKIVKLQKIDIDSLLNKVKGKKRVIKV